MDQSKALFGGPYDDYGPCSCRKNRATVPVALPKSWLEGNQPAEIGENFPFAMGYDFRRFFGPEIRNHFALNFSACPDCCHRAEKLGLAREVESVQASTSRPAHSFLGLAAELIKKQEEK